MTFADLRLAEPILKALAAEGYDTPTPIQAQTIPHVLDGKDVLGCAQTGTGKTAAFALPVIHKLSQQKPKMKGKGKARPIRALILSPTRELAAQITASFEVYAKNTPLKHTEVYGGVSQKPQVNRLKHGVDILVATPGRLQDLMNQGYIDLTSIETFVLDEADQMLDMGFIPDIRRITKQLPSPRQTLMFSATMPPKIKKLADSLLNDPVRIEIAPAATPAERVEQSVYHLEKKHKSQLLQDLLHSTSFSRILVFTRTKYGADKVARQINRTDFEAAAIHGNKTQANRKRTLERFRQGTTSILVATDVAARGIDIDDVSHVINFDLPNDPETYVHRIGRTGRAGASGIAISFCSPDEKSYLRSIERLTKKQLEVLEYELKESTETSSSSTTTPTERKAKPKSQPQPKSKSGQKRRKPNQSDQQNFRPRRKKSKSKSNPSASQSSQRPNRSKNSKTKNSQTNSPQSNKKKSPKKKFVAKKKSTAKDANRSSNQSGKPKTGKPKTGKPKRSKPANPKNPSAGPNKKSKRRR